MANETITEAPKDCDDSGVNWESGKRFEILTSILQILQRVKDLTVLHFNG